ncbi:MAG TPA: hypothetical protein VGV89_00430 [Thermoplasmata archaeon]|nr:hypothetical protein [Thermoplasmata archaeon]
MTAIASLRRVPERSALLSVLAGLVAGLLVVGFSLQHASAPVRFSTVVQPAGEIWTLTPPSTWCTTIPQADGFEQTCTGGGAAYVLLNVTQPSRVSGAFVLSGPAGVWVVPVVYLCEISVELTHAFHSCPPPWHPPPFQAWTAEFPSAGTILLSQLPMNFTSTTGILPAGEWEIMLVDATSTNITATLTAPVVLTNP